MVTVVESSEIVASIPTWVDVAATAVGALSGALTSLRARFDISGTLLLAIVTGLGGSIIRDLILARDVPVAFSSPLLLPTAVGVALVVILSARHIDAIAEHLGGTILVVDALFLGVYSIVGAAKGINAELPGASCVLLGVLTGLGGGLLRDILVNEQPEVLRPGAVVAMASVLGCSFYVLAVDVLELNTWALGSASIVVIVLIRLLSVWRRWESPPTAELPSIRRLRPGLRPGMRPSLRPGMRSRPARPADLPPREDP